MNTPIGVAPYIFDRNFSLMRAVKHLENVFLSSDQRQKRFLTQAVIPFLNNLIFQYTNPIAFETEAHTMHTIPLIPEPFEFLYYFKYKTLDIKTSQTPFPDIFNPVQVINTGTF